MTTQPITDALARAEKWLEAQRGTAAWDEGDDLLEAVVAHASDHFYEGTVTPVNLNPTQSTPTTTDARADALSTLAVLANSAVNADQNSEDPLDALGRLRLIELATAQARRAVVADAHSRGFTAKELADTLNVDYDKFNEMYGAGR